MITRAGGSRTTSNRAREQEWDAFVTFKKLSIVGSPNKNVPETPNWKMASPGNVITNGSFEHQTDQGTAHADTGL